jgi:hypothetical protein
MFESERLMHACMHDHEKFKVRTSYFQLCILPGRTP